MFSDEEGSVVNLTPQSETRRIVDVEAARLAWKIIDYASAHPASASCVSPESWIRIGAVMSQLVSDHETGKAGKER